MNSQSRELLRNQAVDALYHRRVLVHYSFATDVAASELSQQGTAAFSIIEESIRQEVLPLAKNLHSVHELDKAFPGLIGLLVIYLQSAGQALATDVISFLQTLPKIIQYSALRAANIAYRTIPKQASDLQVPDHIHAYFEKVSAQLDGDEELFAKQVIESLYRNME